MAVVLDGGLVRPEQVEEPLAQGVELQGVEQLLHHVPVRGLQHHGLQHHGQVQIPQQVVQPAVALDAVHMLAQRGPHLAADRVKVLQDPVQAAVTG